MFLEYEPDWDVNMTWGGAAHQTPLHIVCAMDAGGGEQVRSLRWLLERGAAKSLSKHFDFGLTPLQILCFAQTSEAHDAIMLLKEFGSEELKASVNLRERPCAKMRKMRKIMSMLSTVGSTGGKPDAFVRFLEMLEFDSSLTALHRAAEQGNAKMVASLIELGADPAAKDRRGRTAYDKCLQMLPKGSCQPKMLAKLLGPDAHPTAVTTESDARGVSRPTKRKVARGRGKYRVAPMTADDGSAGTEVEDLHAWRECVQPLSECVGK